MSQKQNAGNITIPTVTGLPNVTESASLTLVDVAFIQYMDVTVYQVGS
jgi:hypothetical protein